MSEERKRILEMLSQGKISVDEAERLLTVVDDSTTQPDSERPSGSSKEHDHENEFNFAAGIGDEIKAGMAEAEAALRGIGPEVATAVRGAEKIVRQAMRQRSRTKDRTRSRNEEEESTRHFQDARPFSSGALLSVRNKKGDVEVETWDKHEASIRAEIIAKARTEGDARLLAEAVRIEVLDSDDGVRIETHLANEDGELRGSWEANLQITIPETANLDIESRHGLTQTAGMAGDVTIRNGHGNTKVGSVAGTLRVRQSHGNLTVESTESDATIDVRHGRLEMGTAGANVTLRNSHGDARIGTIGRDINTFSEHGNLTLGTVDGSVEGRLRHSKIQLNESVAGNVVLDASHGSLRGTEISGDVLVTMRHGSIDAERIGGRLDLNGSHTPVSIRHIEKDAAIVTRHAHVALEKVAGNAVVESSHGSIKLNNVEGKVEVVGERGKIEIREASDEVSVRSDRAEVTIVSESPVRHDYRIINNRGNLNLQIPADSDVRFQGSVDQGEVHCTIPSITVDQTTRGKHVISGQLGEGTGTINLDMQRSLVSIATGNTEQPPGWDEPEVE
jgi:hypothetical protein